MAEIIDLDFYRKFRVVLPIRPSTLVKDKSTRSSKLGTKRYRKRNKVDDTVESKSTKTE